jgi:hypothetical protein
MPRIAQVRSRAAQGGQRLKLLRSSLGPPRGIVARFVRGALNVPDDTDEEQMDNALRKVLTVSRSRSGRDARRKREGK